MASVIFVQPDGGVTTVQVSARASLMRIALNADVPGILGECGGSAMCATCHIYVEPTQIRRLPPANQGEDLLLEGVAADRRFNSRLACQISVHPDDDNLTVYLPEHQL